MTHLSIAAGSIPRVNGSAYFFQDWRVVAFQATGQHHIHDRLPCQDAILYGEVGPVLWCAMADGVSSERLSQAGAKLLVEAIGEFLAGRSHDLPGWNRDDLQNAAGSIVDYCRDRLVRAASGLGVEVKEFSSTLQAVIIHRELEELVYFAIGDGHCLIVRGDEAVTVLGLNRASPEFGTATVGQNDHEAYFHSELVDIANVQSLLLFTDGLDRYFIRPRVKDPAAAAPAENVAKVSGLLRNAATETDAVSNFGRIVTNPKLDEFLRDDRSLLGLCRCQPVVVVASKPLEVAPGPELEKVSAPPSGPFLPDNAKEVWEGIQAARTNRRRKIRRRLVLASGAAIVFLVAQWVPNLFTTLQSMFDHVKPVSGGEADRRAPTSPTRQAPTPALPAQRVPTARVAVPQTHGGLPKALAAGQSPRSAADTNQSPPPRREPTPASGSPSAQGATPTSTRRQGQTQARPTEPSTPPAPTNGPPSQPIPTSGNTAGPDPATARERIPPPRLSWATRKQLSQRS